jgi:hypothetical protein
MFSDKQYMTWRYMQGWIAVSGALLFLAACEKKQTAQVPVPPVQNAFTEYVDRGVTTMNKAQTVADESNAQTQQLNAQAQAAGDAQ